jgi:hypothetical protein
MVLVSKRTSLYATVSDNISCWLFWRVGNLPGKATLAGQEQLFGEGGSYESLATNTHSSWGEMHQAAVWDEMCPIKIHMLKLQPR